MRSIGVGMKAAAVHIRVLSLPVFRAKLSGALLRSAAEGQMYTLPFSLPLITNLRAQCVCL
jgi:hypothetical protein